MSKDKRLYARFDIAMDEHPKIMLLSDAAFRALIESTMYSRRQLTDGFLHERIVLKKWGQAVADELSSNDENRPSWVRVDNGWALHDYAKHQVTSHDIEAKREAGRLGGLAKAKRNAGTSLAPATKPLEQNPGTSLAKTETETEATKDLFIEHERDDDSKPKSPYTKPFIDWYEHYPRKQSKGDAFKAWEVIRKQKQLPKLDDLIHATQQYARRVSSNAPEFTKLPAGWLRDRKWEDEDMTVVADSWDAYKIGGAR